MSRALDELAGGRRDRESVRPFLSGRTGERMYDFEQQRRVAYRRAVRKMARAKLRALRGKRGA